MNYKVIADSFKNRKSIRNKVMFTAFAVGLGLAVNVWGQVPSYVPTNGLVGWWPFNGNANDESGNGNNGTVNGATLTTDRFGNANKAYSFDGVDDFINCGTNPILSLINGEIKTINFWAKRSNGEIPTLNKYENYDASNSNFSVGTGNNIFGVIGNGFDAMGYPDSVISWTNYTIILNAINGNSKLYLNGNLVQTSNITFSNSISDWPLFIGKISGLAFIPEVNGYEDFYGGQIDDIGIWNRPLTDQEISDLYNANICYEYVTVTDTLVINTGITGYNPITYLNTLKIWPNPSNDHITIDAGNLATINGYSIKIEDAQGQQVFQNAVNQQQFYIDITTWGGNGLYFVRIIDPQGNTVDIKKIVLQ